MSPRFQFQLSQWKTSPSVHKIERLTEVCSIGLAPDQCKAFIAKNGLRPKVRKNPDLLDPDLLSIWEYRHTRHQDVHFYFGMACFLHRFDIWPMT